jgi:hypothetical protein
MLDIATPRYTPERARQRFYAQQQRQEKLLNAKKTAAKNNLINSEIARRKDYIQAAVERARAKRSRS